MVLSLFTLELHLNFSIPDPAATPTKKKITNDAIHNTKLINGSSF
jgi:hypothetical protein